MDIPDIFLSDARRAAAREMYHGDAHVFGPEPARSLREAADRYEVDEDAVQALADEAGIRSL